VEDAEQWPLFREVTRRAEAWPTLMAALGPALRQIARRQPIGRLRDHEDTPHEIVIRVFDRFHAREIAAIHTLCAIEPPRVLRVIVRRSALLQARFATGMGPGEPGDLDGGDP
jgi:hypothetical protein